MKEINEELVEKHNREEEMPENRLRQVREIVSEAQHSVGVDYPKERTQHLLDVALKCIDRHISEIESDDDGNSAEIMGACDAADTILYMMEDTGLAKGVDIYDERFLADEKAYHEECEGEEDYDPSGFTPAGREMFECIYNEFRGDE